MRIPGRTESSTSRVDSRSRVMSMPTTLRALARLAMVTPATRVLKKV